MTCGKCDTELITVLGGAYCPKCNPSAKRKTFYLIKVNQNMEIVEFIGPGTYDQCFDVVSNDPRLEKWTEVKEMRGEMEFETFIEDQELGPLEAKWIIREATTFGE